MVQVPTKSAANGCAIPVFGLGTWQMGGKTTRDPNNDDKGNIKAIRDALLQGLMHVDTAEMYAAGHTEKLVGEAIRYQDRANLFLASKVWKDHLRYDDLIKACQQSLARLKTKYLDLYLVHGPNPAVPMQETMRALDTLVADGLVRHIGVCNFTVARLTEAQSYAKTKFAAVQAHFNLICREPEEFGVVKYCQENGALLIAWRPVQKGALAEAGGPIMQALCKKYRRTPAQIAINWLISQPGIVTLSTMRQQDHLYDNLGALGWQMTPEDVELVRQHFPGRVNRSDAVPLG